MNLYSAFSKGYKALRTIHVQNTLQYIGINVRTSSQFCGHIQTYE